MTDDTEEAGFSEPDRRHPLADLSLPVADEDVTFASGGELAEAVRPCGCLPFGEDCDECRTDPVTPGETTPAGVTRWTCTHAELAAALHRTRQCRWMNDPALATMAREILAQLPEAGPDQSGEIARLKTERAEMTGQLIMAKEGVWGS